MVNACIVHCTVTIALIGGSGPQVRWEGLDDPKQKLGLAMVLLFMVLVINGGFSK